MIQKIFDSKGVTAIVLLIFGLCFAWRYSESFEPFSRMQFDPQMAKEFIKVGPFSLGMLLGSRILSDDKEHTGNFWFIDRAFWFLSVFSMALSLIGLTGLFYSKEWFVIIPRKGEVKDVTVLMITLCHVLASILLGTISKRMFGGHFTRVGTFVLIIVLFSLISAGFRFIPMGHIDTSRGILLLSGAVTAIQIWNSTHPMQRLFSALLIIEIIIYSLY